MGGGGGANVFALGIEVINTVEFFVVFLGMILFCVAVDRVQALCEYAVEGSPTNTVFLQKVYTELLMFGAVAITIFILAQAWPNISPEIMTLLTFVDLLCSLGACSLIGIAGVLGGLRYNYCFHWFFCEARWQQQRRVSAEAAAVCRASDGKPGEPPAVVHGASAVGEKLELVADVAERSWQRFFNRVYTCVTVEDYNTLAETFLQMHQPPKRFCFYHYLEEILTQVCCKLMSIHWLTWVVLSSWGLVGLILKVTIPLEDAHDDAVVANVSSVAEEDQHRRLAAAHTADEAEFGTYIAVALVLVYAVSFGFLGLFLNIRKTYHLMLEDIRDMEKRGGLQKQVGPNWADRRSFFLQVLVLSDTFLMSFYWMHTTHVLTTHDIPGVAAVKLAFIGSFVANFLIFLPMSLPRMVLVESFYCFNHEAYDGAIMTAESTAADLQYMFTLWTKRGEPQFAGSNSNLNRKGFATALQFLGMGASKDRMRRMFHAFDRDGNGLLDMNEMMSKFNEMKAALRDEDDSSSTTASVSLKNRDGPFPMTPSGDSSPASSPPVGSSQGVKELLEKMEHMKLQHERDMTSICHAIENLKQENDDSGALGERHSSSAAPRMPPPSGACAFPGVADL